MYIRRLTIGNFRGIEHGVVDFNGHTLLVGGNNTGKSTICEALELVLGPERIFRRPVVDEHDFHKGRYLNKDSNPLPIRLEAVLIDLPDELERKLFPKTRPWSDASGGFIDEEGAAPADADGADVRRALPVTFLGWYDRSSDDFTGQTYFSHPVEEVSEDDENFGKPGAGLARFGREWKLQCGFIYLRTLRTGRRALSLERGSLLDTILRLGDTGKESMWEDTVKRLREFPIGTIPQLQNIRNQVRKRMSRFVGLAEGEEATSFFASELTREHLREVVRFFIRSQESNHSVPFHRLGTGAINTLVFALLTHIADLRGSGSVVFAMEEPEIALPPHAQRRVTRYILKNMGQAIISSHSPYVIEEFALDQVLAVSRHACVLQGTVVPTMGIKHKTLAQNRRQLAEAVLSRGVVVAEGAAEAGLLPAASSRLEALRAGERYDPFDLTGVAVFDAQGQGNVPKWGPFFAALDKAVFAFQDEPSQPWTADDTTQLSAYTENCETAYPNLESLLVTEVPPAALRRFLTAAQELPDYPTDLGTLDLAADDQAVRGFAKSILRRKKGEGYGGLLMEHCQSEADLPETVTAFLIRIHDALKLPPLDEESEDDDSGAEAPADPDGGDPARDA